MFRELPWPSQGVVQALERVSGVPFPPWLGRDLHFSVFLVIFPSIHTVKFIV